MSAVCVGESLDYADRLMDLAVRDDELLRPARLEFARRALGRAEEALEPAPRHATARALQRRLAAGQSRLESVSRAAASARSD